MRFAGEGGNIIHLTQDEMKKVFSDTSNGMNADATVAAETEPETEVSQQKKTKKNENLKRLFDGLKGKFIAMFEDVDEEEMK
jgi:cell division protein FtsA